MDLFDHSDKKAPPMSDSSGENPPTLIANQESLKLQQPQIEEALLRARKKLTEEDFVQASSILETVLQNAPDLPEARLLQQQVIQSAERRCREMFDQGITHYMESDWDRAASLWNRALQISPNNETVVEWIGRLERKRELEKGVRADLLKDLEECGKMLSNRNYVVAEEHLDSIKNKFTGGFRLVDLQKIYEALVVRTRVELEKEFEDLRSNVIETSQPVVAKKQPPGSTSPELQQKEAELQKQYMAAFEAGKKHFDGQEWHKALQFWQTARTINPHDVNLIHWIALAENNLIRGNAIGFKSAPVRATVAFLSVFAVTAVILYLAYERYADHSRDTKNRKVIQLAIEHYRAGRLEESWKMLQIYVLQDPENDSARTLLERVTAEIAARESFQQKQTELITFLQQARDQKKSGNYQAAVHSYERVLRIDNNHPEATRELGEIAMLVNTAETKQNVSTLLHEADRLFQQKQLDPAAEQLRTVLKLDPANRDADSLLARIETERAQLNRITAQLEVARYLVERKQKESAVLVLNRILSNHPGQPQAKQMLSMIRGTASVATSSLEVRIKPAARLWVDGRDTGVSSYFKLTEPVGTHILHIEQRGFKNLDLGIEVKKSGKNEFDFQLQPM